MHDKRMARIRHPRVPGNNSRLILQINTANQPSWRGMPWIRAAAQSVNGAVLLLYHKKMTKM